MTSEQFEIGCDMIDATMMSRPDIAWKYTDKKGHAHQWYVGGNVATRYDPMAKYETPTLVSIFDGMKYYEDGAECKKWHKECRECGERIEPEYCSDDFRVLIPGPKWCKVNGEYVSKEIFDKKWKEAHV